MSKPALQWIPGFMHTARSGNMTRAAEQLNVTVSALSHQMRRLEERMGRRLMERGARGIQLTAEGQALYQKLEPHYQAIEELLSPHTQEQGNSLTISSLGSLVNAWLLPRLGDFVRQHPDIQINLDSSVRMVDFDKELRTLDAFQIDVVNYLFVPRVISGILSVVLLSALFSISALFSGFLFL